MVITMAKLRMAHASTHGARKPPGPILKVRGNDYKIGFEKKVEGPRTFKTVFHGNDF